MGSESSNPYKPAYDISMSKRTRKPLNLQTEADPIPPKDSSPEKENPTKAIKKEEEKSSSEGEESDHKSLKQLIKSRSPLGQHFTEEKQLPLVVRQHEEDLNGVKFKGLVSRYAKVLSRLIKIKRGSHLKSGKKPTLRLTTSV
ncbi:hypothetical protein Vadar_029771 [Vaccinium darrowii]|uniref:Uncharacterized protein n=1 Tax=Vaccinium darrowii TaxID=229202 RepID=A0ACB7ZG89_9ERIC|nr:hypothetical protein Vadar_029771 [Vaccinium darrowii]